MNIEKKIKVTIRKDGTVEYKPYFQIPSETTCHGTKYVNYNTLYVMRFGDHNDIATYCHADGAGDSFKDVDLAKKLLEVAIQKYIKDDEERDKKSIVSVTTIDIS